VKGSGFRIYDVRLMMQGQRIRGQGEASARRVRQSPGKDFGEIRCARHTNCACEVFRSECNAMQYAYTYVNNKSVSLLPSGICRRGEHARVFDRNWRTSDWPAARVALLLQLQIERALRTWNRLGSRLSSKGLSPICARVLCFIVCAE